MCPLSSPLAGDRACALALVMAHLLGELAKMAAATRASSFGLSVGQPSRRLEYYYNPILAAMRIIAA